jgi:dipeptidyl-peptidase-4
MDTDSFPGQLARTQRFTLGVPRSFTLSPDGARVLFLRTRGPESRVGCLWLFDGDGERLLADPDALAASAGGDGTVPAAELVRRERARERTTGIVGYAADAAVRTVVVALAGELWVLDLDDAGGSSARRVPTPGSVVDPRPDSGGRRVAYVSGGDLHVVELEDGKDRIVSDLEDSPDEDVTWGLPEHVATESMHRAHGYWWSPDGTRLLAARVDVSRVQRWWISDPSDPARAPRAIPYPAAGTANADVSLHMLALDGSRVEVDWDREAFEYVTAAAWDEHGPLVTVQSRDQRTVRILTVDPDTGATELLHEQRDAAWVELVPGTPARTASGVLVHYEDRGDTRSLTVGGRAVTPEALQLLQIVSVHGESVIFIAGDEPTEEHLWVYEDGEVRRLSDGPGVHSGKRAGGTTLLASLTEAGREVRVMRAGGAKDVVLKDLSAVPTVLPRVTWLRLGELQFRAALLLPSWHRPGERRLPVLLCPYGGPAARLVMRTRISYLSEAQWFAEAGFAVLIADGRGTPGRGPEWDRTIYGDRMSLPLQDQVTALHAAAEQHPDLDLDRVGIRGWSYGGYLAAAAVLRRPDVFHAAIAGAPVIDQTLYDTHWTERFLGHPEQNREGYELSSLLPDAPHLRRPLLLVHGLADDNVVPAHTLRLSAALLAAGRPHRVLPLAATTHMPTDEAGMAGLLRHQLDFLCEALGVEEPED